MMSSLTWRTAVVSYLLNENSLASSTPIYLVNSDVSSLTSLKSSSFCLNSSLTFKLLINVASVLGLLILSYSSFRTGSTLLGRLLPSKTSRSSILLISSSLRFLFLIKEVLFLVLSSEIYLAPIGVDLAEDTASSTTCLTGSLTSA